MFRLLKLIFHQVTLGNFVISKCSFWSGVLLLTLNLGSVAQAREISISPFPIPDIESCLAALKGVPGPGQPSPNNRYSARESDHVVREAGHTYIGIMNTEGMIDYMDKGGPARAGLLPYWSSRFALGPVFDLEWGVFGVHSALNPDDGVLGRQWPAPTPFINAVLNEMRKNPITRSWMEVVRAYSPIRSALGPLGLFGPLNGNFCEGPYGLMLGTASLFGDLVLGPPSPNGGMQFDGLIGPDPDGLYRDERTGRPATHVNVRMGNITRKYRIFELLDPEYVHKLSAIMDSRSQTKTNIAALWATADAPLRVTVSSATGAAKEDLGFRFIIRGDPYYSWRKENCAASNWGALPIPVARTP
jgi:hypothetical protein